MHVTTIAMCSMIFRLRGRSMTCATPTPDACPGDSEFVLIPGFEPQLLRYGLAGVSLPKAPFGYHGYRRSRYTAAPNGPQHCDRSWSCQTHHDRLALSRPHNADATNWERISTVLSFGHVQNLSYYSVKALNCASWPRSSPVSPSSRQR